MDYYHYATIGKRETMEDTYAVEKWQVKGKPCYFFGLFDGHGGSLASKVVAELLPSFVMFEMTLYGKAPREALTAAFLRMQQRLEAERPKFLDQGTTAVVVLIFDNVIYCANSGDSRAVLFNPLFGCMNLSKDHKPSDKMEKQRIEAAGGFVSYNTKNDVSRVWTDKRKKDVGLSTSRSIGDLSSKTPHGEYLISPIPDVTAMVNPNRAHYFRGEYIPPGFVIMACDGIWDVLSSKDACAIVQKYGVELAPRALTEEALRRGSTDNITVLVIPFQ